MPIVSNCVPNNRGNYHLQLLRRFNDIAFSAVGSFYCRTLYINLILWLCVQLFRTSNTEIIAECQRYFGFSLA